MIPLVCKSEDIKVSYGDWDVHYDIHIIKTYENVILHQNMIQDCIASFFAEHSWKNMWGFLSALNRVRSGQTFIIGLLKDTTTVGGYGWYTRHAMIQNKRIKMDDTSMYLYNVFVSKRHRPEHGATIFTTALTELGFKLFDVSTLKAYTDDWNIPAYHMFLNSGWKEKEWINVH